MVAILTSSVGGYYKVNGKRYPTELPNTNRFREILSSWWMENARVLFFPGWPESFEMNDENRNTLSASFSMSGLSVSEFSICDNRKMEYDLSAYDVVILGGGHVPTQNRFFERLGLKQALQDFSGLLIAWSAGSMNCGETVYALPEDEGEGIDPEYHRFLQGLGITKAQIIPHYQRTKDEMVDGMRVIEDMAIPDSMGRCFYCLVDGSFLLSIDGKETLHGEACRIRDGNIQKISEENDVLSVSFSDDLLQGWSTL